MIAIVVALLLAVVAAQQETPCRVRRGTQLLPGRCTVQNRCLQVDTVGGGYGYGKRWAPPATSAPRAPTDFEWVANHNVTTGIKHVVTPSAGCQNPLFKCCLTVMNPAAPTTTSLAFTSATPVPSA